MEIINPNVGTLCNFEVLKHLQKLKGGKQKDKGQLATITYETLRYLENTAVQYQAVESIKNLLKALEKFNLNMNEKLMIINTPPTTAVEIQLLIEESEEKLTEEQVEELLQLIATHFPEVRKVTNQNNEVSE